jgi:hypothetical protein
VVNPIIEMVAELMQLVDAVCSTSRASVVGVVEILSAGVRKGCRGREEQRGVEFDLLTSWFEFTVRRRCRDFIGVSVVVVVLESRHST